MVDGCSWVRPVYRGWWSQVVSGVVTLGCLSPRPRLHAPVGACVPVCACVHACACVQACACVPIGGVCGGVAVCAVVAAYLFFCWPLSVPFFRWRCAVLCCAAVCVYLFRLSLSRWWAVWCAAGLYLFFYLCLARRCAAYLVFSLCLSVAVVYRYV